MASGKLSPRQKMINMMYLVLTALLALNVSKEILDSFVTVNNGLETTKLTLKQKMDGTYSAFGSLAAENPKKFGAAWSQAQEVQSQAADLVKYIDQIKAQAIAVTEGMPLEQVYANDTILNLLHVKAKDNQDAVTNLMIGDEPAKPKEGEFTAADLRQRLEVFRDKIKSIAGDKNSTLVASVEKTFSFPREREAGTTGVETSWESKNFYHVPLAAAVTILSKLQMDVRNAENECVNWLMGDVEGKTMKFSELAPVVVPVSNYITMGDSFRADVYLAGYDPLNPPTVELSKDGKIDTVKMEVIGDKDIVPIGADGKAKLRIPGNAVGQKEWKGIIRFKQAGQEERRYPFYASYEVAQPNLVVSPTKMNVFYRGVENPVDISVPGFSADKIQPSITNGQITKAQQGYIVRPGGDKESVVSVSVTMPDGSRKSMQGVTFRVKTVPDPVPYFANKSFRDDKVSKGELSASLGVTAKMEGFDFDLKFEVTEFTISTAVSGNYRELTSKSNRVTPEMQDMLKNAKPGQRIFVERIKVKGPDGSIRTLPPISLKVT